MRKDYEMTEEQLATLLESMKPVPMIMLQSGSPPSQQESANSAWERLGKEMGFDYETVKPNGRGGISEFWMPQRKSLPAPNVTASLASHKST